MRDLLEKYKGPESPEGAAQRILGELKKQKVRRVSRARDELYIESGDNEAAIWFEPKAGKAHIRMVINRSADISGESIVSVLKKNGVL